MTNQATEFAANVSEDELIEALDHEAVFSASKRKNPPRRPSNGRVPANSV